MSVSIADFWKLLAQSGLYSSAECDALAASFAKSAQPTAESNASAAAQWLVSSGKLTRYQAATLLRGRGGPFVLGPVVVEERIEAGRLARLFRGRYGGKQQVLVVPAQWIGENDDPALLAEWSKAAAAVKSPHVSRSYGAFKHRSQLLLVAESVSGSSLEELLAARSFAPHEACQIGWQVAVGLAAMHQAQLVHGGLMPRNILVSGDGTARLLQFPLAPVAERQQRLTLPLAGYLAPELADRAHASTAAGDVYALGCTLYELIAGKPPLAAGTANETLTRHRGEDAPPLDQVRPGVSGALADLVIEMLAKDPSLRLASAAHAAQRLKSFATDAGAAGRAIEAADSPAEAAEVAPAEETQDTEPPEESDELSLFPTISPSDTSTSGLRRRGSGMLLAVGAALVLVLALGVWALLKSSSDSPSPDVARVNPPAPVPSPVPTPPADNDKPPTDDADRANVAADTQALQEELVDDDGKTLWTSPTHGPPLDLSYLPGGVRVLFALRPQELWSSTEGKRMIEALGPGGAWAQERVLSTLGVEPTDIEQLLIAFASDDTLAPRVSYVMRLARAIPEQLLLAEWGRPAAARHAEKTYYQRGGLGYFFPPEHQGRVVVIAPEAMLKPVLEQNGRPLLQGGIESLAGHSDAERQFTVLFAPSYLFSDGQDLLAGNLAQLRVPLRMFLDERIDAVMFSVHLGDALFVELRAVAPIDLRPPAMLELLRTRWDALPERIENYTAGLDPQPYGRLVVNRFPRMLQLARDFTRGGVEDRQAVLRAYLPAAAAHNLVLGAELTLLEKPATSDVMPEAPEVPRSLAEKLQQTITFGFVRESFDQAFDLLAAEIDVPIVIRGSDLQADGITRNQSLRGFDERNRPADAVLRKLLKLANPADQLVYVVGTDEGGREALVITTRTAASSRGETLPAGF